MTCGMEIRETDIHEIVCPESVKPGLSSYASCLVETLGDDLAGAYLCGSVARGCYQPITSDIDIVVVVKDNPPANLGSSMLLVGRYVHLPLDSVVVTESQARTDVFPTPIELFIKPGMDAAVSCAPGGSGDFLLLRQDTYEAGIPLAGPHAHHLMTPVPWRLLAQCLDSLFPNIVSHFKNPILMLCRVAYAWTKHELCSKEQAGDWACDALGAQWFTTIRTALTEYACGNDVSVTPREVIRSFEIYCSDYINNLREA